VQDTVTYVEFPNSLAVDFYSDSGIAESRLTALYARYKENQDIVFLRDSVKVINIKGDTLHCQELYWDRSRTGREFYTDKAVRIRTRTQIIDGIGMEASQDFKQQVIKKPTGIVGVPSSQFPM
jgi:LPS export ABC transporter protein LptC